jgi:hypothetical protein
VDECLSLSHISFGYCIFFDLISDLCRFPLHFDIIKSMIRYWYGLENLDFNFTLFCICICIWYVVEPNYGFYTTGRESADGGLYWR